MLWITSQGKKKGESFSLMDEEDGEELKVLRDRERYGLEGRTQRKWLNNKRLKKRSKGELNQYYMHPEGELGGGQFMCLTWKVQCVPS